MSDKSHKIIMLKDNTYIVGIGSEQLDNSIYIGSSYYVFTTHSKLFNPLLNKSNIKECIYVKQIEYILIYVNSIMVVGEVGEDIAAQNYNTLSEVISL